MSLPSTMRALAKTAPGEGLTLVERPVPQPGPGDALIRVTAASICGTDVHIYNWDEWSQGRIKPPVVLGHEFAGEVVALGAGVVDLALGTPVSAEGHILLPDARHVVHGQEHLAKDMEVIGIDRDGAFAIERRLPPATFGSIRRTWRPRSPACRTPSATRCTRCTPRAWSASECWSQAPA